MSDSVSQVPDPRVLEETLAEGRRVLDISMSRLDQEFRRTERLQALILAILAAAAAGVGVVGRTEGLSLEVVPRVMFLLALTINLLSAVLVGRTLSGTRRNAVSFGVDLGRMEAMLENPAWDLTACRTAVLHALNRDVRFNKEEERRLLSGRSRGLRILYVSASVHLLNLIFILGGVFNA